MSVVCVTCLLDHGVQVWSIENIMHVPLWTSIMSFDNFRGDRNVFKKFVGLHDTHRYKCPNRLDLSRGPWLHGLSPARARSSKLATRSILTRPLGAAQQARPDTIQVF